MGLTANFTPALMFAPLVNLVSDVDRETFEILSFVGESFVNDARLNGDYGDITGNLRSSIGYVIYHNKDVAKQFIQKGEEGRETALDVASELKELAVKDGWTLFVFAGMNYGVWVEAKGYNVLTAYANDAEKLVAELVKSMTRFDKKDRN